MVHHEGLLELDAIYLFEASPQIVRYREQPETIRYPDGSRLRRYTPDFELTLVTGEIVLVEIKPVRSLEDMEVKTKLELVAAHLSREGRVFVILTDTVIRREPYLKNFRWIYHQSPRVSPTAAAGRVVLERHRNRFPSTLGELEHLLSPSGVNPFSLLLSGLLRCPLSTELTADTQITLAKEADDGWFWIAREYGF